MKAVVKTRPGEGNVVLTERPKPKAGPGEVVIRVMSAGVCGTDIKIFHGVAWSNPPVTLGHEYSGIVESVGEGVSGISKGDRVVSETAQVVCGECEYCRTGRPLMCEKRLSIGYGVDGAFAEYIAVRSGIVHKIPDGLSYEEAALCEPFAVALHGVWDHAEILPTDTVLVMGPGAVGQLAAQAARAKGARVILVGTPSDGPRLEIARNMGIRESFDSFGEAAARELTKGKGADVAVDCTGALPAIRNAMRALKKTGRLVQIGLTKPTLEVEYSLLTERELSIVGSFGHQWKNWEQAIRLMASGKVNVKGLITGHYPLEKWRDAFDAMERQDGIKILIHPNRE